ncbi:MAG: hypothetical protein PPP58_02750 [Natronomonas sp.]
MVDGRTERGGGVGSTTLLFVLCVLVAPFLLGGVAFSSPIGIGVGVGLLVVGVVGIRHIDG